MCHTQCTASAACCQWSAIGMASRRNLQPTTILAQAWSNFRCVNLPTEPVMPETHDTTTTASREGLTGTRNARCDRSPTPDLAKTLRNIQIAAHFLELLEPLLPGSTTQAMHSFRAHTGLLLVHPGTSKAVLVAHRLDSVSQALISVPRVRHQPLDMAAKGDLPVDLCLFILHLAHTVGVTKHGSVR